MSLLLFGVIIFGFIQWGFKELIELLDEKISESYQSNFCTFAAKLFELFKLNFCVFKKE